jgi:hypothetical protein
LLHAQGKQALPAILVDGDLKSSGRYPSRDGLAQWTGLPSATSLFTDGVAALVTIGAAIASNCEQCSLIHYDKAQNQGSCCAPSPAAAGAANCC